MAGVFKSLDKSDVRITPFRTHKLWSETLESTTTITNPNGYALSTSSIQYVTYPYKHRADKGPRLYFIDTDQNFVSYQVSTGQVAGTAPYIESSVNYLTSVFVFGSPFAKSNQFVLSTNYPNAFEFVSYDTDLTTQYGNPLAIQSLQLQAHTGTQETVNHLAYHGHLGNVNGRATTYACTSGRLMYITVDSNHQLVGSGEVANSGSFGGGSAYTFLGSVAKGGLTSYAIAYDIPQNRFTLHTLPTTSSINTTPDSTINYTTPIDNWSWNPDWRIKTVLNANSGSAVNSVMFLLKQLHTDKPSPIFMMASGSGGSGNILNGNFVALLQDSSFWDSYSLRSGYANRKYYAVTSEGYVYKDLKYRTNQFTYGDILDLRQYVGVGNVVIDAVITADNDVLQTPGTPKMITMMVKPLNGSGYGLASHQLISVNVETNEVYNPIHLGSYPDGYLYKQFSYEHAGCSNIIANGTSVLGVSGFSILNKQAGAGQVKVHTFNINV